MHQPGKKTTLIILLATSMVIGETRAMFHRDDNGISRRNLRVIPKNVSDEELTDIMRHINKALGVNCSYCHQQIPGQKTREGHQAHDFASDAKIQKQIARKMMRMTRDINERLGDMGDGAFEKVSCMTCHRGHTQPSFTMDSLQRSQVR